MCGVSAECFPPGFLGSSALPGVLLWTSHRVSVKSEEKGVYGFLLQDVAAQLRVAGAISAVH